MKERRRLRQSLIDHFLTPWWRPLVEIAACVVVATVFWLLWR